MTITVLAIWGDWVMRTLVSRRLIQLSSNQEKRHLKYILISIKANFHTLGI